MGTITFTNDLGFKIEMSEKNFERLVHEMIDFAVNTKGYELAELTTQFIVEDITGIIESASDMMNDMNDLGLEITEKVLNEVKSKAGKFTVSRYINGISLNGTETLLDNNGSPMLFDTVEIAIQFLKSHGCTDSDIENITFV